MIDQVLAISEFSCQFSITLDRSEQFDITQSRLSAQRSMLYKKSAPWFSPLTALSCHFSEI